MFRTARSFLYYAFFAALSLLLHAWLLFPRRSLPDPAQMANLARQIQIDLQQIESLLPEAEDAPPPKIKETPKPLEDVSQPDPLPATKEPEPSPASAVPEDPAEEPVEHTQVLPTPPPEPTEASIATLDEYRRFLAREMTTEGADGLYLPKLRFKDNTPAENLEIMRYFGMELIAYPKSRKFYVTIDPDHDLYGRSNDFTYIRNFSNRVIYRTSPYFDDFRREAARHVGIASEELVVAQLLKPASAAYLGWKEAECARHVGVTLEDVTACDATFTKTAFGAWIIRIDALALKDGRTIQVQDFEWARLQRGAR